MMKNRYPTTFFQAFRCVGGYALAAFAGSFLAACTDDAGSPLAASGPAAELAASTSSPKGESEFIVEDRFTLDVDVEGSLKPGQPIHLKLTGTANFATEDAEVRVSLPEVSAAEQSSWGAIAMPVGEETVPHLRMRRGFTAGEKFQARATLTIPEPGYYFVAAAAKQHSHDRMTDRPHMVSDVSQSGIWLWIDDHGGKVTEQFDSTLFAPDDRKERGPRTKKSKAPRIHRKGYYTSCTIYPSDPVIIQACPGTEPVPPPAGSGSHSYSVGYDRGGNIIPVPGIRYVWELKTSTGQIVNTGQGWADASGNVPPIDCQGGSTERFVKIDFYTLNNDVKVIYQSEDGFAGGHSGGCGGANLVGTNAHMAELFLNLVKTAEGHKRIFGALNPSRILARLTDANQTGYYPAAREIRILATNTLVFGEYGVLVAAHEWGHWWQDATLFSGSSKNGLVRYYTTDCKSIHPPQSASTVQCAFGEAFADWYAVTVRGSATGRWVTDLESDHHHLNCQPGSNVLGVPVQCSDDGGAVQGAIHSFLYDLTDDSSTNEAWDFVRYEPWVVTAVIKECWVKTKDATNMAYDGIDHLILCMEGRLPYEVKIGGTVQTLFAARNHNKRAQSYLGRSLALGSDFLRRTWLVNLYSKRFGTDPQFERGTPMNSVDYSIDPDNPDGPTDPPPEEPTDPSGCEGSMIRC
jgi:hypothetical protein